MAAVEVKLLGRPSVHVAGTAVPPPGGAKSWAVLAYLAVGGRPCARIELAELLFGDAVDPLGALRWNLAALRRTLGRPDALKGDPIALDPDIAVDAVRLDAGDLDVAHDAGGELLAGLGFPDCPLFEIWLANERGRLRRRGLSLLRETAVATSAAGDHESSIRAARSLVMAEPFDEGHHALLIRTLALADEHDAARRHFEECSRMLQAELQVEPGPAILAAVRLADRGGVETRPDYDEVCARIGVAWQSFLGGAIDHGIDMGRAAVALADAHGDPALRIAARLYLAGMLGVSVRGWDEVATATSEAEHIARLCSSATSEARARAVRAGNELMRGDYQAAHGHALAGSALSDDAATLALNLSFLAAVEADTNRGRDALDHVERAVLEADDSGDPVSRAYAHAYLGHVHLLDGSYDEGRAAVERAIEACTALLVLKPWPMAMLAEIDVGAGRLSAATRTAQLAEGLAAATGIAYQRALAQRALALVAAARGDESAAMQHLHVALGHAWRTSRQGYAFHWPVAWVLESLAVVSARTDPDESARWTSALRDHAAAVGMSTFVERADRLAARGHAADPLLGSGQRADLARRMPP